MGRETIEAYVLGGIGLVKGVYEVYVKSLPGDAIAWLGDKLVDAVVPSQEELDALINEVEL